MMLLSEMVWNEKTVMFALIFSVPIITIIGGLWYKIERTKSDNELKRSMVERGMSADETERVMAAGKLQEE